MPVTPTYPGVYIEEIPSGVRTITGVATSIAAFVGFTGRGPVDTPVRIFSFADYERNFGGLHQDSLTGYAVQQFFLNGGTDAYVVRVAKGSAAAEVTLQYFDGTNTGDSLAVSAANDGAWGNNLRLDVDYDTANPNSLFNLGVTLLELQNGALVPADSEQHRNLSMNSRSSAYAVNVVNNASRLVTLKRCDMSFNLRGYSLSEDLKDFTSLGEGETVITGLLDGVDPFTLVLNGTVLNSLADVVDSINTAIGESSVAGRLVAAQVDALGVDGEGDGDDGEGGEDEDTRTFLKISSVNDTTNPASKDDESSSVTITSAASNDAAASLHLGLANGGREKEGASNRRPMPTGTFGGDLAATWDTTIQWESPADPVFGVWIKDYSVDKDPIEVTGLTFSTAPKVGPELRDALQDVLRDIDPATKGATVELVGTHLRVLPSPAAPNTSIAFINGTPMGFEEDLSFVNVQEYSLGIGPTYGAQAAASMGADGIPPTTASEFIDFDADKRGIYALRDVDLFNLLAIPETTRLTDTAAKSVIAKAIALCREERAFFLLDPDPNKVVSDIAEWVAGASTDKNAAVYFPEVQVADPLDGNRLRKLPPSGTMAGVFSRTDAERGVWKAPAGTAAVLRGVQALTIKLTDQENGVLNPKGVNALRTFPDYGRVAWGARTLQGNDVQASEWKYVPIRRLALFIEESLYRGTQWVVFEPNDEPLWAQIRLNVGAFMQTLFRQGAFQGTSPREAYFVRCDKETTTQNDVNRGIVNVVVGFAPLKPAEFVIIKIQQIAGQIQT